MAPLIDTVGIKRGVKILNLCSSVTSITSLIVLPADSGSEIPAERSSQAPIICMTKLVLYLERHRGGVAVISFESSFGSMS